MGLAHCQSLTPGSLIGRAVYHRMDAEAAAGDRARQHRRSDALFAVTLAAFQQQQQRCLAAWDQIMATYDDDTELDAENGESAREIKRRRVYERKDYKKSGWWQELQEEALSDHTSRAAQRFRRDFCVPYAFFKELVELVKERDWFPTAARVTASSG